MTSFLSILQLTDSQVVKLSDICAESGQVFLASVVLPSLGFGGAINMYGMGIGIFFSGILFAVGLHLAQNSPIHYEL